MMYTCTKCAVTLEASGFYTRPDGRLHSWCKACLKQLRKERNPEIAEYQRRRRAGRTADEKLAEKDHQLRHKFGINLQDYNTLLEAQCYSCAICGKLNGEDLHRPGVPKELAVDHCHRTGAVRGLLCSDCNHALGQFKDDPALLRRAADYVEAHTRRQGRALAAALEVLENLMQP